MDKAAGQFIEDLSLVAVPETDVTDLESWIQGGLEQRLSKLHLSGKYRGTSAFVRIHGMFLVLDILPSAHFWVSSHNLVNAPALQPQTICYV